MTIFLVVGAFSIVQSLFGVGLLVFGTPTLLLLGHPFAEALAVLLPASLAVSLLQLLSGPPVERAFITQFVMWCLVPLALVLGLVLAFRLQTSLNLVVALTLAIFVVLRTVPGLGDKSGRWVLRHQKFWLLLMGVAHGLSNLGGGLLTILAASRHTEKERIRKLVAVCYSCFAIIQLAVLATVSPDLFGWRQLAYAATSAFVFLVIGQHIFRWVSAPIFTHLFTAVMASYATLLGLRVFGLI